MTTIKLPLSITKALSSPNVAILTEHIDVLQILVDKATKKAVKRARGTEYAEVKPHIYISSFFVGCVVGDTLEGAFEEFVKRFDRAGIDYIYVVVPPTYKILHAKPVTELKAKVKMRDPIKEAKIARRNKLIAMQK